jgi:hypothetical protein
MTNWFYYDNFGVRQGLITSYDLVSLVAQGIVTPQTRVETEDGKSYLAGQLSELFPQQSTQQPQFNGSADHVPPAGYQQLYPAQGSQSAYSQTSEIKPPPDYLIWSIITTLCMCVPTGIIAIVLSVQAKSAFQLGDYASAKSKSTIVFWINLITLILWGIFMFCYIAFLIYMGITNGGNMNGIQL